MILNFLIHTACVFIVIGVTMLICLPVFVNRNANPKLYTDVKSIAKQYSVGGAVSIIAVVLIFGQN